MISSAESPSERARAQLRRLFPGDPELTGAAEWAADTLRGASLDPAAAPLRAVHALRRADRRLTLIAARYLVERAADQEPGRGPRHRSAGIPPIPPTVH